MKKYQIKHHDETGYWSLSSCDNRYRIFLKKYRDGDFKIVKNMGSYRLIRNHQLVKRIALFIKEKLYTNGSQFEFDKPVFYTRNEWERRLLRLKKNNTLAKIVMNHFSESGFQGIRFFALFNPVKKEVKTENGIDMCLEYIDGSKILITGDDMVVC